MSETPGADQPVSPTPETSPAAAAPPGEPAADEVVTADRLFSAFALGVMALLVICIVLVLIASRNVPAGL